MNDLTEPPDALVERLRSAGLRIERGPSLAPGALRLARRKRRRRRAGAAVACLAALAVVVPAGFALRDIRLPDASRQAYPPATGARPSASTAPPTTKYADLAHLPTGQPPKVPWYVNGIIHDGKARMPLPIGSNDVVDKLVKTRAGYVALVLRDMGKKRKPVHPAYDLVLVRPDGSRTTIAHDDRVIDGPVVSTDGAHIAWSQGDAGQSGGTPDRLVYAGADGTILHHLQEPGQNWFVAAMWGKKVLLVPDAHGQTPPVAAWDPTMGRISTVSKTDIEVEGVTPDGSTLALSDAKCMTIRRPPGSIARWRDCKVVGPAWFSPDGTKLVTQDYKQPSGKPGTFATVVMDATDGSTRLRLERVDAEQVAWEDNHTFVFVEVTDDRKSAVVRCRLDGACQRTTPVVRYETGRYTVADDG